MPALPGRRDPLLPDGPQGHREVAGGPGTSGSSLRREGLQPLRPLRQGVQALQGTAGRAALRAGGLAALHHGERHRPEEDGHRPPQVHLRGHLRPAQERQDLPRRHLRRLLPPEGRGGRPGGVHRRRGPGAGTALLRRQRGAHPPLHLQRGHQALPVGDEVTQERRRLQAALQGHQEQGRPQHPRGHLRRAPRMAHHGDLRRHQDRHGRQEPADAAVHLHRRGGHVEPLLRRHRGLQGDPARHQGEGQPLPPPLLP